MLSFSCLFINRYVVLHSGLICIKCVSFILVWLVLKFCLLVLCCVIVGPSKKKSKVPLRGPAAFCWGVELRWCWCMPWPWCMPLGSAWSKGAVGRCGVQRCGILRCLYKMTVGLLWATAEINTSVPADLQLVPSPSGGLPVRTWPGTIQCPGPGLMPLLLLLLIMFTVCLIIIIIIEGLFSLLLFDYYSTVWVMLCYCWPFD